MAELKPGWKRVKFGEVVRLNKETCKDPQAAGINRVIGLEHLEPGDLRVHSWADVADGTTFTNRVRPGQVLFGKRRAYQRKVAVADFDAICSGDIYVFETADPTQLMQELLPYICQTDSFFEYAVGTSAGSLSPRTNWKSLTQYELALPPLEEQRRMVKLMTAAHAVTKYQADAHSALAAVVQAAYVEDILGICDSEWITGRLKETSFPKGWSLVPAEAICVDIITKGATPTGQLTSKETGIPFYKVYNLTFSGALDFSVDPTWITALGHNELRRSSVRSGDILMNIVGPPLGKVSRVPKEMPEGNINQAIARFRTNSDSLSTWLEAYLLSPIAQTWLSRRSKKTSGQQNLTLETCRDLLVPIPPDLDDRLALLKELSDANVKSTNRFKEARDYASMVSEWSLTLNPLGHEWKTREMSEGSVKQLLVHEVPHGDDKIS
jgi:type I restriction enzyme, S subunit